VDYKEWRDQKLENDPDLRREVQEKTAALEAARFMFAQKERLPLIAYGRLQDHVLMGLEETYGDDVASAAWEALRDMERRTE